MATVDEQHYATEYTGLISTAGLCLGFMTVMLTAFETFPRLKRKVPRRRRREQQRQNQLNNSSDGATRFRRSSEQLCDDSIENYTMGYLYRARVFFGKNRGPRAPQWPLAWAWQVAKLPQRWYLRHSGLDSAVYVRFVTAAWFFMLSQLLTTAPVLLALHIHFAPSNVLPSSIGQASVSSLIDSTTGGRSYLWVHTVLLWWQAICWITVVVYLGWGNIEMRREQIVEPFRDAKDDDADEENDAITDSEGAVSSIPPRSRRRGWRFRTCKVSNIPQHMRNDEALRHYFDSALTYLKRDPALKSHLPAMPRDSTNTQGSSPTLRTSVTSPAWPDNDRSSLVEHVVIVRRLSELHDLSAKRKAILHDLEASHVTLARQVMLAVGQHVLLKGQPARRLSRLNPVRSKKEDTAEYEDLETLSTALGRFLPSESKEFAAWQKLYPEKQSTADGSVSTEAIWEALADLPPRFLDRYQPVVKLKTFRGQVAPAIDYYLTKLNLLTSLVEDLRLRPDSYAACDTAFVTFYKASDARLARRELSWIRAKGLTCRVRMAPDARDLDWNKLVQANFRGDVLRSFVVQGLVWAATIVWIIPMGALVGLVSIDNLSTRIPSLANWLNGHARAKSLFSSLIPTIVVTVINMLVPTIIIQVSGRGQTFVTLSKLHHATWCRYWKWVIINVVIAFCAGTALFTSLLGIFTGRSFSETADNPLNVIASSFSNGAVFFVSYTILIIATQCFFELAQFMIPWFMFLGVRKAMTPRQRFAKTEPRRFFAYTVSPNHTLVISVILVFSLLNPLPICFVFIYFSFAFFVFKDHFARLYWRVYYEGNGRLYYMRIMRYSLDALVLGQVVTMALFFVLKEGKNGGACAALIPITVIVKLVLTRWYDTNMDAADAVFADVICGQHEDSSVVLQAQAAVEQTANDASDAGADADAEKRHRLSIRNRLSRISLPRFSVWDTLRYIFSARKNLNTDKGPQGVLVRLVRRLENSNAYAELRESSAARKEANKAAAQDLAEPSAERTLNALEHPEGATAEKAPADCIQEKQLSRLQSAPAVRVVPHPRLQRDDRPDYSAYYVDPALAEPVEKHLWLPRDPLYSIDLDDTIDWYGRALVSSEGGEGIVGTWVPESEDSDSSLDGGQQKLSSHGDGAANATQNDEEVLSKAAPSDPAARPLAQSLPRVASASSASQLSNSGSPRRTSRLLGTEKIKIAELIAARAEAEDGFPSGATGEGGSSPLPFLRRLSSHSSSHGGLPEIGSAGTFQRPGTAEHLVVPADDHQARPSSNLGRSPSSPAGLGQLHSSGSTPSTVALQHAVSSSAGTTLAQLSSSQSDGLQQERIANSVASAAATGVGPLNAPDASRRDRSHTQVSTGSEGVSQSRALMHEVLQEERTEAIERRKETERKMMSKLSNARKSWRSWYMKAPDDAD